MKEIRAFGLDNCEVKERPQLSPQWFGGYFEAGNSMSICLTGNRAWPILRISEDSLELLEYIRSTLGVDDVSIYSSKADNSNTLSITRERAVTLAGIMSQYVLSKRDVIEHILWWGEASNAKEKYQVGLSYKNSRKKRPVEVKEYCKLLSDPLYAAGVIDAKGRPWKYSYNYSKNGSERVYRSCRKGMRVYSNNINLLSAVRSHYLGSKPIWHDGVYIWSLEGDDYDSCLEQLGRFMVIYPERVRLKKGELDLQFGKE